MAKKELGAVTKVSATFASGIAFEKALDMGVSFETLEGVFDNMYFIGSLLVFVATLGYEFLEGKKTKTLQEKVNHYENTNP